MAQILVAFAPLIFIALLIVVCGTIGAVMERRHLSDLDRREAANQVAVTNLRHPSFGADGRIVSGSVVLSTNYWTRLQFAFRSIVGGEVRTYQRLLDRARREAMLRMVSEADRVGATTIVNVRVDTSMISPTLQVSEVIAYGTAVRS